MILDTLESNPKIGIISTFGTVIVNWLDILTPVASFISICVGILVGMVTLVLQWRKLK